MKTGRVISTVTKVDARLPAPPSKSVTQRALMAAALATGRSRILRPLLADDPRRLIAALDAVGIPAAIDGPDDDPVVSIEGQGGRIPAAQATLDVGNAGTAMRFLTAVLASGSGVYVIGGDERMRQRPIGDLLGALRDLGAEATSMRGDDCPPVRVGGGQGLRGGTTKLPGGKSSQYLSALLLAAPNAAAGVRIEIEGELVSRPYVDLTIDVMERFGVALRQEPPGDGARVFIVAPGQRYAARDDVVEGDYSSASYFFAAAAITGGRVEVERLAPASRQGDARFLDLLIRMGCRVERRASSVVVEGPTQLQGIDANLASMPDVAQTLAICALFANGSTRIRGVTHLRIKETDRIGALVAEIRRLGGEASPEPDGLSIIPRPLHGARIETYGDHRMAMAFAVAGLRTEGIVIADPGCVSKSFPGFWDAFDLLPVRR
ncbi:MAG TPA: 3-phosphoshikimate 1-carboxyvinyltransferase [Candidatus Polarisedimenticolia bacterium]